MLKQIVSEHIVQVAPDLATGVIIEYCGTVRHSIDTYIRVNSTIRPWMIRSRHWLYGDHRWSNRVYTQQSQNCRLYHTYPFVAYHIDNGKLLHPVAHNGYWTTREAVEDLLTEMSM